MTERFNVSGWTLAFGFMASQAWGAAAAFAMAHEWGMALFVGLVAAVPLGGTAFWLLHPKRSPPIEVAA